MAKADERGLSADEIAITKAMADKICEEIDNDLKSTLQAEIDAAQKQHPYPYAKWDAEANTYKTITLTPNTVTSGGWSVATAGATVGQVITVTMPDASNYIWEFKTADSAKAWTTITAAPCGNAFYLGTEKLYDGLTATQCLEAYERRMRGESKKDDAMTQLQLDVAKAEWSFRLKVKVAESQKIDERRVLVDLDVDD